MNMNIITDIINEYIESNNHGFYSIETKQILYSFIFNELSKIGINVEKIEFTLIMNEEMNLDITCLNSYTMNIFKSDRKTLERYVKLERIFGYE